MSKANGNVRISTPPEEEPSSSGPAKALGTSTVLGTSQTSPSELPTNRNTSGTRSTVSEGGKTNGNGPPQQQVVRSRRARRSNSDEIPRVVEGGYSPTEPTPPQPHLHQVQLSHQQSPYMQVPTVPFAPSPYHPGYPAGGPHMPAGYGYYAAQGLSPQQQQQQQQQHFIQQHVAMQQQAMMMAAASAAAGHPYPMVGSSVPFPALQQPGGGGGGPPMMSSSANPNLTTNGRHRRTGSNASDGHGRGTNSLLAYPQQHLQQQQQQQQSQQPQRQQHPHHVRSNSFGGIPIPRNTPMAEMDPTYYGMPGSNYPAAYAAAAAETNPLLQASSPYPYSYHLSTQSEHLPSLPSSNPYARPGQRRSSGAHRKSVSYSESSRQTPGSAEYGAFWQTPHEEASALMSTEPPVQVPPSPRAAVKIPFSPRNEILSLTSGLSPKTSTLGGRKVFPSSQQQQQQNPQPPALQDRQQQQQQPSGTGSIGRDSRVTWSPVVATGAGSIGSNGPAPPSLSLTATPYNSLRYNPSTLSNESGNAGYLPSQWSLSRGSGGGSGSIGSGSGQHAILDAHKRYAHVGEINWGTTTPGSVFETNNNNNNNNNNQVTAGGGGKIHRRQHMRQQSAQLWVQDVKGVEQPASCRDLFFLIAFVFHLIFLLYLGSLYGYQAVRSSYEEEEEGTLLLVGNNDINTTDGVNVTSMSDLDMDHPVTDSTDQVIVTDDTDQVIIFYNNLVILACLSGAVGLVLSAVLLGVMMCFAKHFVQVALVVAITLSFVWGTIGIGLSPQSFVPMSGVIALSISVAYAFVVWDRTPFAGANLLTALSGVRSFPGIVLVSFVTQALALGWAVYYSVVVCGVYDAITSGQLDLSHRMQIVVYVLLSISCYWTFQVLQNVVQVITAGVIGAWWYTSDYVPWLVAKICFRSLFYCMGSICYGSLLVGPMRIIRQLSILVRPSAPQEASLMSLHECVNCLQTCMSSCVDGIAHGFNSWSFTYVGMYMYSFPDGGHHAMDLFEKRGWTTIISDDLVPNCLLLSGLMIGGVTGCFAFMVEYASGLHILSLGHPGIVSFMEGLVIGWVLSSVLFGMISSSVNAVIVCFASSPVDFERNHPELSREMRTAWREVWPGALDVVDLRIAMAAATGNMPNYASLESTQPM